MAKMILEVQKQKLMEMRSFLGDFCLLINMEMENLKDKLHKNVAMGFPVDIAGHYEQLYYVPEKQHVNDLIQTIQTNHYNYLDDVTSDIQTAINRGSGGSTGGNFGTSAAAGAAAAAAIGATAAHSVNNNTRFKNCIFNEKEWKMWNNDQKMKKLDKCADDITKDLGIAKIPVKAKNIEEMAQEFMKIDKDLSIENARIGAENTGGYYDSNTGEITINEARLANEPEYVLRTLAHEYRHRWQDVGEDVSDELKENWDNYIPYKYNPQGDNFRDYCRQPVERDARKYGEMISGLSYPERYGQCEIKTS